MELREDARRRIFEGGGHRWMEMTPDALAPASPPS
jgi:hypothetical protein